MDALKILWSQILYALLNMRPFDVLDILAIAFIIYQAIKFFRETRAGQLVKGIVVLLIVYLVAVMLDLVTLKWLLVKVTDSLIIVAVIVFQPELRRLLESMGRTRIGKFGKNSILASDEIQIEQCINSVCKAVSNMQEKKIGALIVFEMKTPLGEIISTGTELDAVVSTELVQNVFYPKSPLHDGGAVIRGNRIMSAGCILPLTSNNELSSQLGTRHRAAIGISEASDAVVVVVSEETGTISVAHGGNIKRDFNPISLHEELCSYMTVDDNREKFSIKGFLTSLLKGKETNK